MSQKKKNRKRMEWEWEDEKSRPKQKRQSARRSKRNFTKELQRVDIYDEEFIAILEDLENA